MAEKKELTEEEKKKFKIIKILDEWRWQDFPTDFEYNFGHYCDTLKNKIRIEFYGGKDDGEFSVKEENKELAEKILLTHYLIYICNRQMNANRVFREGLPVISQIVEDYYDGKISLFNYIESNEENKKRKDATDAENSNDNHKYYFTYTDDKNKEKTEFASRFFLTDVACMYKTLINLKQKEAIFEGKRTIDAESFNPDGNFSTFLKAFCTSITELATALYELTYQGVPVVKKSDIKPKSIDNNIIAKMDDYVIKYVRRKTKICKNYEFTSKQYNLKRLWCVIRDYLYHPVFKELFKIVIDDNWKNFFEDKDAKIVKKAYQLELPGDVWNNNDTFATHFWGETYGNSSKFVRDRFDKNGENNGGTNCWDGCYPHQFDITFNLVPRMCESDNCSMCPICENKGMDKWQTLCHKTKNKYCSFALYATGIKHECKYGEKAADNDKSTGCELLDAIQDKK